jgi:CRP-like cAMP-binding protein
MERKTISSPNHLLSCLPIDLHDRIIAQATKTDMEFGQVLNYAGQRVSAVYFPLSGFISQIAGQSHQKPLEVGMIGREGMVGAPLILGIDSAPFNSVVQGNGVALKVNADDFVLILAQHPVLATLLSHYVFVQLVQLTQSNLCQCFHPIAARLAKWLLMSHDRASQADFHLTHHFIADMIGVRRSTITIAAGALQKAGIIHYSRGTIGVLDRQGLEASACECYQADLSSYQQYLHGQLH